jgi:hypothetical protein
MAESKVEWVQDKGDRIPGLADVSTRDLRTLGPAWDSDLLGSGILLGHRKAQTNKLKHVPHYGTSAMSSVTLACTFTTPVSTGVFAEGAAAPRSTGVGVEVAPS